MAVQANAYPRKHFFFEMFTRDISLEACIMDLIDNSIDGLIRTKDLDISAKIMEPAPALTKDEIDALPTIEITYSATGFKIIDHCGGITRDMAKNDLFNFGHSPNTPLTGQLGVYGIGLKRAIFKLGEMFEMESKTVDEGFTVKLNLAAWAEEDSKLEDWRIPINYVAGTTPKKAGTSITVTELHDEVKQRIFDGTWARRLYDLIAQTYCCFLNRYVRIIVNGDGVTPTPIPLGESAALPPAVDEAVYDDVNVKVFAGLADPGRAEFFSAGWYILCNARVTVAAEKTDLTGWGIGALPVFHSKYIRFIGIAFFHSKNPLSLPWTTTKRGINRESSVYQRARQMMGVIGKQVTSFLSKMYPSDAPADIAERRLADKVTQADVRELFQVGRRAFAVGHVTKRTKSKTTTKVQYDATNVELEAIRKHVRKPSLGANKIGEMTFDYYMDEEGLR